MFGDDLRVAIGLMTVVGMLAALIHLAFGLASHDNKFCWREFFVCSLAISAGLACLPLLGDLLRGHALQTEVPTALFITLFVAQAVGGTIGRLSGWVVKRRLNTE